MSLTSRLDKIAAALGPSAEPQGGILLAGADGVPRTSAGEAVDLATLTTAPGGPLSVILYRDDPAGPRPASADPPPPPDDK